ncbi:disulfide bond formation protein B [Colwellia psychrerythraea]|uniref:Disulfide bond formation protein DsbB n=1 Tax=Colwellia psychrerythraea TaxID=28229 RepID=A0A099L1Y3_COLPS|nr:disulfide bond formation protein B [Colwellia psychrerythraea]KGJ95898.1 Disulfide bond formation protein DsbB [Colwellia psychrerythraea]
MINIKAVTVASSQSWNLLFLAWILATSGTLISLFFSEIVQLPVCVLCWYQRIALYPLVIMMPFALFPLDINVIRYAQPLVIFGWFVALFHVLVVAKIIPEAAQPCVLGIPCSETHFNLLGFINIPVMSLLTFSLIGLLLFISKKQFTRTLIRNNHEQ